jgi:hypothetical protein|tara:strand:+ start:143 stop:724 length:582 start_codon:yes stop_codon:yes gene_type:complete
MQSVYSFVVSPKGSRYNNTKDVDGKKLILNTDIFNHQFTNREAVVLEEPKINNTSIRKGDTVLVHHNVFRRWTDVRGDEKNSKNYFEEDKYIVYEDQIFLYKHEEEWLPMKGFCFIQPIKAKGDFDIDQEEPLKGIVEYTDGTVEKGELVGFTPNSQYEFVFNDKRLYRVYSKFITIKYEYQGDEEVYNPSWA